ncbi:MAG: ATP-binding protein [Patescibacteria group bacterium]
MSNEQIQTNYFVVTGGPGSGKSTLLDYISYIGYITKPEVARVHIDTNRSYGLTTEQIRQDELLFQREVASEKSSLELRLVKDFFGPDQVLFLDRGYQPDSLAYYIAEILRMKALNKELTTDQLLQDNQLANLDFGPASRQRFRYRGIFILSALYFFQNDYARTETQEEAEKIDELLFSIYTHFGYPVISIPNAPLPIRAETLLEHARDLLPDSDKKQIPFTRL